MSYRDDDWIAKAVVAAEDRRFWSHRGVDPLAVARSCKQTAAAMRRVSGASTLSMQLIRLSGPRPRTLTNQSESRRSARCKWNGSWASGRSSRSI